MTRSLQEYRRKRDFKETPEPRTSKTRRKQPTFVIQKHAASSLHYDFRLQIGGVLVSWAIPKGPSLDPAVKRLAMMTEDHPLSYGSFEGVIPEGNYGAGEVIVWDRGAFINQTEIDGEKVSAARGLREGQLRFRLEGHKLHGAFSLRRWEGKKWLLVKIRDEAASKHDPVRTQPGSVISGRTVEQLARRAQ
jgi:DNA ligase D-like protein (predicted 3'-phosphoesterase)